MSNKKVHLHIGRPKTGTTSIQTTMYRNRRKLASLGVLYPQSLPVSQSRFFVESFALDLTSKPLFRRSKQPLAEILHRVNQQRIELLEELKLFKGQHILLSGESGSHQLSREEIENMKSFFDESCGPNVSYHILLYTRAPDSFAQSCIQQLVKSNRMTLEDAILKVSKGHAGVYRSIYANYASVFGDAAIEFRSFEVGRAAPGGLSSDLLRAIGVAPERIYIQDQRRNESLSREVVEFLSWLYVGPRISGVPPQQGRETRVPVSAQDLKILKKVKGAPCNFLNPLEQTRLWQRFSDDNQFLSERFGITYEQNKTFTHSTTESPPQALAELDAVRPKLDPHLADAFDTFLHERMMN